MHMYMYNHVGQLHRETRVRNVKVMTVVTIGSIESEQCSCPEDIATRADIEHQKFAKL